MSGFERDFDRYRADTLESVEVTVLAGGTGSDAIAQDFVDYLGPHRAAFVVPMADSGSKTGALRELITASAADGSVIPLSAVGDGRRAMAALANNNAVVPFETRLDEGDTVETVTAYRRQIFRSIRRGDSVMNDRAAAVLLGESEVLDTVMAAEKGNLKGYMVGNIVMADLFRKQKGDIGAVFDEVGYWLETGARVLPVSTDPHHLHLRETLDDGTFVDHFTEGRIDRLPIRNPEDAKVWVSPVDPDGTVGIYQPTRVVTELSRRVIAGPSSIFTSYGAIVSVPGMSEALQANKENGGKFAAIANLVIDRDSEGLDVPEYVTLLGRLAGRAVEGAVVNEFHGDRLNGKVPLRFDEKHKSKIDAKLIPASMVSLENVTADPKDPIKNLRSNVRTRGDAAIQALAQNGMLPVALAA